MTARSDILDRIRAARPDVRMADENGAVTGPGGSVEAIPRDYRRHREIAEGVTARFCERVADYRAAIEQIGPDQVPAAVAAALSGLGARRVGVPPGLADRWSLPASGAGLELVVDDPVAPLDVDALQSLDAVLTGSAVGIAETGTVVLDGGSVCGRRALTLVPDAHVCIVAVEDIVDDVPAAVARLRPIRPLTWISGPSATSDIELNRVEGVHGPRRLHVLVVAD